MSEVANVRLECEEAPARDNKGRDVLVALQETRRLRVVEKRAAELSVDPQILKVSLALARLAASQKA